MVSDAFDITIEQNADWFWTVTWKTGLNQRTAVAKDITGYFAAPPVLTGALAVQASTYTWAANVLTVTFTALGYTGNGGPGGADGNYSNGTTGTTRGPSSTIRNGVTSEQFGLGGDFWPGGYVAATPLPGHGAAGAFAGGGVTGRPGSHPGAVWIAYEIDG